MLIITPLRRGSSSVVEHHVANVRVEGSNPFSRSNFLPGDPVLRSCLGSRRRLAIGFSGFWRCAAVLFSRHVEAASKLALLGGRCRIVAGPNARGHAGPR